MAIYLGMKMKHLLPFCLCLLMAGAAYGQHYNWGGSYRTRSEGEKRMKERTYIGVSMPIMNMNILSQYADTRSNSIASSLFSVGSGGIGMRKAIGLIGGACFKLVKLQEESMIALDVAMSFDLYNYNVGFATMDTNNYKISYKYTGGNLDENLVCEIFRLPISVMFKTGNEVTLNMSNKPMFSAGAGFAPSYISSAYATEIAGGFKVAPFVVAEIGMYCLKLRAAYYFGNYTYVQATGDDMYTFNAPGEMLATASSSGTFVLTLAVLPSAYLWGSD